MSFSRTVKTGAGLAGGPLMNMVTNYVPLSLSVCKHCRKHRRLCPVCAGVI